MLWILLVPFYQISQIRSSPFYPKYSMLGCWLLSVVAAPTSLMTLWQGLLVQHDTTSVYEEDFHTCSDVKAFLDMSDIRDRARCAES